ncbi:MAG: hypothetical protein ACK5MV_03980 [Aminipila sp.]
MKGLVFTVIGLSIMAMVFIVLTGLLFDTGSAVMGDATSGCIIVP